MMKHLLLLLLVFPVIFYAQNKEIFIKKIFLSSSKDTLRYQILIPKDRNQSYPLVLFLHGAGERGNDNEKQLTHGSNLFLSKKNQSLFPSIVVFPQCPKADYWVRTKAKKSKKFIKRKFPNNSAPTASMHLVVQLLDSLIALPYADKSRVYVMGLSMGGMGTFDILSRRPHLFAGAISICGAGNINTVKKYAHIPLWVFHGAKDEVVSPIYSSKIISSILKLGGYPRYTLYDGLNHNSWDAAFGESDLLEWLYKQTTHAN